MSASGKLDLCDGSVVRSQAKSSSLEQEQLLVFPKRVVTPPDDVHFIRCTRVDDRGVDEIDRDLDELIEADPYDDDPPSEGKDCELARALLILDSLEEEKLDR